MKLSVIIPAYNQEILLKRALESVPASCEIIVIDDASTDHTMRTLLEFQNSHPFQKIEALYNIGNQGVSVTVNKGLEAAAGDYVVLLGSDDFFYTHALEEVMSYMDGTDLIYFDLITNDDIIFHLCPETKLSYCGSVKLMRRAFISNTRNKPKMRVREDFYFYEELLAKNPTEIYTNIVAKHYNYPREGSLSYLNRGNDEN